jgi:tRNA threonylcarbamoyladenosine biosynthesis protein TsaE
VKEFEYTLEQLPVVVNDLLPLIEPYKLILLIGEMGAGKTTFVSQLCQSIGVKDEISSPTFALVNEYVLSDENKIFHLDLYRIIDENELLDLGFEDILEQHAKHIIIEWPQVAANLLPEKYVLLKFEKLGEGVRKIKIKTN